MFGAIVLKRLNYDTKRMIFTLFHPFLKSINIYSNFMVFKNTFLYNLFILIFIVLLGVFNLGYIFIPILIVFIGATVGFRVGFLVSYLSLKGFWLSIIGIYPQYLFFMIAFIGFGALSMSLSENPFRPANKYGLKKMVFTNKEYYILYCLFLIFSFFGIIIESFCSPILRFMVNSII